MWPIIAGIVSRATTQLFIVTAVVFVHTLVVHLRGGWVCKTEVCALFSVPVVTNSFAVGLVFVLGLVDI